jgi:8-oxo-dGTP pyrophosphatase MutT (NUDIX family)
MSEHRRPEEVAVAVRRPGRRGGTEFLVVLRSQAKLGYWHVIAGGVEWGETPAAAAARELREETGLDAEPEPLGDPLAYDLSGDPESVRERFEEGTESIVVWPFVADAPGRWEPVLDAEHVDHRWLDTDDAVELLHYPEPRELVRRAAR